MIGGTHSAPVSYSSASAGRNCAYLCMRARAEGKCLRTAAFHCSVITGERKLACLFRLGEPEPSVQLRTHLPAHA